MEQGFMERFHLNRKKLAIFISAIFIVIAAIVAAIIINQSKIVAVSMRIFRMVGTVNLYDNGRERSMKEKMRLKEGNSLKTAEESLVMISLDEIKLFTMEESSRARVIPARNRLEYKLEEGSLYFNVTEKLAEDENFEITTSTMICGIRGTSGFVGQDKDGHETLMVTDGIVHVVATNPVTKEVTEVDVVAGEMITIYLDDEAEGDATISINKKKFREEDLPALALDAIAKSPELMDRIFKATGFFSDKIKELARLSSTPGLSMYGQAIKELDNAGIDDAIPFMGKVSDSMVIAANNAVDIAQDDLALEVAILTGTKDVHDNGYDNGYRGEALATIMDSAMKCVDDSLVSAKDEGLSKENLRTLAETLADTLDNATEKMTVAGLDSNEISSVIDAIGTVIADAIETGAENGDILSSVSDASSFVKNVVTAEMIKDSNGAETVAALLGKDSIAVADLGESNASGNVASSDNSTNVSGNGNGNSGNGTQGANGGNNGTSGNDGNNSGNGNGSGNGSDNGSNDNGGNNNNGNNNNNNNGNNNNSNNNNNNNNGTSGNNGNSTGGNTGGNSGGNTSGNTGGNSGGNNGSGTVTVPASGSNVASSVQTALNTAGTDKVVITKDDNNNGNVSIGDNVTIPNGKSLEIGNGVTVNVASGSDIKVAQGGTLTSYGTIENYGTFVNEGTIQNFCNDSIHNHGIFINMSGGKIDNGDGDEEHKGKFINYEDGIVGNKGDIVVDESTGSSFINYGILAGEIKNAEGESYTNEEGTGTTAGTGTYDAGSSDGLFYALTDNDTKLIIFGVGSMDGGQNWQALYSRPWADKVEGITEIKIYPGIDLISAHAFDGAMITEIDIPDTVLKINYGAFSSCPQLKTVHMSKNVRTIDADAFAYCSQLEEILFDEGSELTTIGVDAFNSCAKLEYFPFEELTKLESIENFAFEQSGLKSVDFPDSLEKIGKGAFYKCTALGPTVTIPSTVTYFDGNVGNTSSTETGAFSYCTSLKNVILETFNGPDKNCFEYCTNLETIQMHKCSVGLSAFWKCDKLTQVIFDGTESMWNSMTIENTLERINYQNRYGNTKFIETPRVYLQKDIYVDENIENGSVVIYYNGKENYNGARPGGYGTFKVTPNTGYVFSSATVTYGDTEIPVEPVDGTTDMYRFLMPDSEVTVSAEFTALDYSINIPEVEGMTVTANIEDLSKAHVGDEIILTFTPDEPEEFDCLSYIYLERTPYVRYSSNITPTKVTETQYRFTMPAYSLNLKYGYYTKAHSISIKAGSEGYWRSDTSSSGRAGYTVNMYFYTGSGYRPEVDEVWVKNTTKNENVDYTFVLTQDSLGDEAFKLSFTMPKGDVEYFIKLKKRDIQLLFPEDMHGLSAKAYVDGKETTTAHIGDTVTVVFDDSEMSPRYLLGTKCYPKVYSEYSGTWSDITSGYNIVYVPDAQVYTSTITLSSYYDRIKIVPDLVPAYKVTVDPDITGGTVSLRADSEYFTKYALVYLEYTLDDNADRVFLGFEVTDADGGEVYVTDYYGDYYFSMPDKDVTVSAKFSVKHAVSLGDCTNGSLSFPNDLESVKMKSGDTVFVVATPTEGYICTGVSAVDSKGNTYDAMWFDPNYVSPIGPINPKGSDGKAGSGGYIPDTGKGGGKDDGFLPIGPSVLDNPTYPDEETFESGNVWSFVMPDDVVNVTATFAEMSSQVFDIDLSAYVNDGLGYEAENYAPWDGQSGSIVLKVGDEVYSDGAAYGQTISLTLEAPEGYCIDSPYVAKRSLNEYAVVGDNIGYTPSDMVYANEDFSKVVGATLTFTMPLSDVDISIHFMPITEQNPADP